MADWCNNSLLINGKEEQVSSFLLDIKEMYNRYEKELIAKKEQLTEQFAED